MKRFILCLSALALGMFTCVGSVSANTAVLRSPQSVVRYLPNDLANTPASVMAAARAVHSEADFAKASPAVQHVISTPVREVTVDLLPHRVGGVASVHPIPNCIPDQCPPPLPPHQHQLWPPGCYVGFGVDIRDTNIFGQTLIEQKDVINNYCFNFNLYGYWVIYTTPNADVTDTSYNGWQFCGLAKDYHDWVATYAEWATEVIGNFKAGWCGNPTQNQLYTAVDVFNTGGWDAYTN